MSLIPSPEQQAVLELGLDTIRIRAGAGTGKTTTVAQAIANLVSAHSVEPERVLGITFTNKAAAELADRVGRLIGDGDGRQVEVHTYHGFAAQLLAEFGALAGVDPRLRVITPTFARQVVGEIMQRTRYQHLDSTYRGTLDRVLSLGDRLGDHLLTPGEVMARAVAGDEVWAERVEMLDTLASYEEAKRDLGVVDYSDLVILSTRMMSTHPNLAAEVRDRYRVVVLDEYQDTNPAQRVLLQTVFPDGFPVIAVGDEDQTIYEWRGASAENFESFPDQFRRPDGTPAIETSLTLNRRSAQVILDVANEIRTRANPMADRLVAADPLAPGSVYTHWAGDALAEAEWIARRFEELHDQGTPWKEMAVLFRKNRDFAVVIDAMDRHEIPVEVANLGGLLSVPEITELRSWLTVIERPEASPSLVHILTGSRYRLGLAQLAPLAAWVAREAPVEEDSDEVPGVSLLEAVEQAEEVPGIDRVTMAVLDGFMNIYTELLVESQGLSLVEVCRLVLDRTGAWQDLDALPGSRRLTTRLNLYRFLDLAEDWSPLRGRPSLGAFLDYLAMMEDEPAEELDSAHLSGEDAVTLVTVHRAKGLEWEVVAIPAVTDQNFPARAIVHPDPHRRAEVLPVELRIDHVHDDMPGDDGARLAYLQERNAVQEWRTAYVATTRPRRVLMLSGAYWYGHPEPNKRPKRPSPLFELVSGHPGVSNDERAQTPPRPEILAFPAERAAPDPLFPDGWAETLRRTMVDPDVPDRIAGGHGIGDDYRDEVQRQTSRLFDLASVPMPQPAEEPVSVSVTGLVTYAQCPKRFYWSEVDRLPRRVSRAATAGTDLHRRIELHQRGQVPLTELDHDLYDAPEEAHQPGGFESFLQSRFASERAALVEQPFRLSLDNSFTIRGRIDAIYRREGSWEVVDFKSGRPSEDPSRLVQLQAYAVAATEADLGVPGPETLDVTFAYLAGGLVEETHRVDREWLDNARHRLGELTDGISAGRFPEQTGAWCRGCDFLRFCEPGRAWVAES